MGLGFDKHPRRLKQHLRLFPQGIGHPRQVSNMLFSGFLYTLSNFVRCQLLGSMFRHFTIANNQQLLKKKEEMRKFFGYFSPLPLLGEDVNSRPHFICSKESPLHRYSSTVPLNEGDLFRFFGVIFTRQPTNVSTKHCVTTQKYIFQFGVRACVPVGARRCK